MEAVFLKIMNMSITASWLVLAVIALRFLLKKAPKAFSVILWGLVGIRLVLPFSFESILSLIPSAETVPNDIVYAPIPEIDSGIGALNSAINPIISGTLAPNEISGANPIQTVTLIASVVWVVGIAAMLLYTLISYLLFRRKVREAAPFRENIYLCDGIGTPFILGVIRPRIYLPSNVSGADAQHVIAHERAHIKRRDHLWKPLGFLLLAVYWFNPMLWIAYILLCRDIELACDERVIKEKGTRIKKSYSEALINCSVPRKMIAACPLAFGEGSVKGRIKSVLNYKKPAFWIIIVSIIACVVAAVCFLTNPISKAPKLPKNFTIIESGSDIEGLSVSVKEVELDTAGAHISIEWKNESGVDIWYGNPYDILYFENGEYASCEKIGLAFTLPAYNLDDGKSTTVNYDLTPFDLTKEGRYRFIVDASKDEAGDIDSKELWIDFEIKPHTLTVEELRVKYPQYFDLDTDKELRVISWRMSENGYYFGLLNQKDESFTEYELLTVAQNGATADEMRAILSSYDVPNYNIDVIIYKHDSTRFEYEADYAYMRMLDEMLGIRSTTKEVERLEMPTEIDINHDGTAEALELTKIYQRGIDQSEWVEVYVLNFTDGDKIIYSEEAGASHAGWNALFLYSKDGQDYLLRYNPGMGTGSAGYSYQLFYIGEDLAEIVVNENRVNFDINFGSSVHQSFDPMDIAGFLEDINTILKDSKELINTDDDLIKSFQREGRQYHIPQFLFGDRDFNYDYDKSMLENLEEYKSAMEAYYAEAE